MSYASGLENFLPPEEFKRLCVSKLKNHDLFVENTTTDTDKILILLKSLVLLVSFLEDLDLWLGSLLCENFSNSRCSLRALEVAWRTEIFGNIMKSSCVR